jgi:membrane protein implicated in regulation of membrane protease activity
VNEILSRPALVWIIVAAIFALAEMLVPFFGFIFVTGAALIAALVAVWVLKWEVQLIVFGVALMAGLFLLRPRLITRIHKGSTGVPSRTHVLLGKRGVLTEAVHPMILHGRVLVEEQDWAAQADEPLPVGTDVIIEGADGIVLKVRKA